MKRVLPALLLFAALIYLVPMVGFFLKDGLPGKDTPSSQTQSVPESTPPETGADELSGGAEAPQTTADYFAILDSTTGRVNIVSALDYTIGAVAAEMPMNYADDALMAQAVAAHSYALSLKQNPDKDIKLQEANADFEADPTRKLGYITQKEMKMLWGEDYEVYYQRLKTLIEPIIGQVLTYDNAPIAACYHAISNGMTQSAEAVWGQSVPYLTPVDSSSDTQSPEFEETLTMTAQEVKDALTSNFAGIDCSGDPSGWFGEFQRNEQNYVTSVMIGPTKCKAADMRMALGLRSTDFTITWTEDHFTIVTHGYGHGVGMSQFGANVMALNGKGYAEILAHYYPGTVLQDTAAAA